MLSMLIKAGTILIPLLCQGQPSLALRPSQYGPGSGSGLQPPTSRGSNANPDASNVNVNEYDYGNQPLGTGQASYDGNGNEFEYPHEHQESVEERLASWRQQQQYSFEQQTPMDAANPRQEDGKMKLLASVSKGSIAMFFFILMWRSVHHYEMADLAYQSMPTKRLLMVLPCVILFLGNMAGCVGSIMSHGALGKKRMKGILNLNKLMEITLMGYNVMRLVLVPSKLVPREIFVGRTLSNFLFLVQCQLFTKVTWNSMMNKNTAAETTYGNTGTGTGYENEGDYEYEAGANAGAGYGYEDSYGNGSYGNDANSYNEHDDKWS